MFHQYFHIIYLQSRILAVFHYCSGVAGAFLCFVLSFLKIKLQNVFLSPLIARQKIFLSEGAAEAAAIQTPGAPVAVPYWFPPVAANWSHWSMPGGGNFLWLHCTGGARPRCVGELGARVWGLQFQTSNFKGSKSPLDFILLFCTSTIPAAGSPDPSLPLQGATKFLKKMLWFGQVAPPLDALGAPPTTPSATRPSLPSPWLPFFQALPLFSPREQPRTIIQNSWRGPSSFRAHSQGCLPLPPPAKFLRSLHRCWGELLHQLESSVPSRSIPAILFYFNVVSLSNCTKPRANIINPHLEQLKGT